MWHICGTGEVHIRFVYGNLRKKGDLKNQGVDWKVVLNAFPKCLIECVGWIYLVNDRQTWWALVNMAMKFASHKMR
jgi:hypothetical protein